MLSSPGLMSSILMGIGHDCCVAGDGCGRSGSDGREFSIHMYMLEVVVMVLVMLVVVLLMVVIHSGEGGGNTNCSVVVEGGSGGEGGRGHNDGQANIAGGHKTEC